MSRFYGDLQGSRGETTRQGTKDSGIRGHIRGWNTGAKVYCSVDPETGKDHVRVYRTSGSNAQSSDQLIAEWSDQLIVEWEVMS